jgi:hypothetical protein
LLSTFFDTVPYRGFHTVGQNFEQFDITAHQYRPAPIGGADATEKPMAKYVGQSSVHT